jgi:hypothetical protein
VGQAADGAVGDQPAGQGGLGVVAVHQALDAAAAGRLGGVEAAGGVGGAGGERLLAEDVLARLQGLDRPLGVHGHRERDVDGVDLAGGQQLLVGAEAVAEAQLAGERPRPAGVAAGHGHELGMVGGAGRLDHQPADAGRRQRAPAELGHAALLSPGGRRPS